MLDRTADEVCIEIYEKAEKYLTGYKTQFQTVTDYKEEKIRCKSHLLLNILLCELCEGQYQKVLDCLNDESMKNEKGGFASADGGDVYNYMRKYCLDKITS